MVNRLNSPDDQISEMDRVRYHKALEYLDKNVATIKRMIIDAVEVEYRSVALSEGLTPVEKRRALMGILVRKIQTVTKQYNVGDPLIAEYVAAYFLTRQDWFLSGGRYEKRKVNVPGNVEPVELEMPRWKFDTEEPEWVRGTEEDLFNEFLQHGDGRRDADKYLAPFNERWKDSSFEILQAFRKAQQLQTHAEQIAAQAPIMGGVLEEEAKKRRMDNGNTPSSQRPVVIQQVFVENVEVDASQHIEIKDSVINRSTISTASDEDKKKDEKKPPEHTS